MKKMNMDQEKTIENSIMIEKQVRTQIFSFFPLFCCVLMKKHEKIFFFAGSS